jgi:hypothetical protein
VLGTLIPAAILVALGIAYLVQPNRSAAPMTARHLLPAWNGAGRREPSSDTAMRGSSIARIAQSANAPIAYGAVWTIAASNEWPFRHPI